MFPTLASKIESYFLSVQNAVNCQSVSLEILKVVLKKNWFASEVVKEKLEARERESLRRFPNLVAQISLSIVICSNPAGCHAVGLSSL